MSQLHRFAIDFFLSPGVDDGIVQMSDLHNQNMNLQATNNLLQFIDNPILDSPFFYF